VLFVALLRSHASPGPTPASWPGEPDELLDAEELELELELVEPLPPLDDEDDEPPEPLDASFLEPLPGLDVPPSPTKRPVPSAPPQATRPATMQARNATILRGRHSERIGQECSQHLA
jgi:hypothetical protein